MLLLAFFGSKMYCCL